MPIPNINAITSQLRMMPDQALQQYAAMHKSDPYILPMAIAESNSRKEMRAAQQAQATGQQQPKVADADIASMSPPPQMAPQGMPPQGGPQMAQRQLPEQQGIGALPAPNMQHMADGGIAGYADGGEFNYAGGSDGPLLNMAGGGEPVMRMANGGVAHFADKGAVRGPYNDDTTMYDPATGVPISGNYTNEPDAPQKSWVEDTLYSNLTPAERLRKERLEKAAQERGGNTPYAKAALPENPTLSPESDWPTAKPEKETNKKKSGDSNTKKKPAANVIPPEEPAKAAAPAKEAPTGADLITQAIAGSKALNDESAAAYKPWHEKLDKENEEIAGRKADNRAFALLAAGLGMMGGTSQYAAQNIAAGGIKGLATFQEAEKADAAARKANQQSQMLLMQAERAERSGNMKVAGDMQSRAEQARQFGITSEQKAEELRKTEKYHDGMVANDAIKAKAAMLAAQNRGGGLYGAEDKHMLALTRVETALNGNKEYQEAAKLANMPGSIGDTARATIKRVRQETYGRLAPELLQSGQGSPTGSGSGVDMSQWGKSQVVKP